MSWTAWLTADEVEHDDATLTHDEAVEKVMMSDRDADIESVMSGLDA